MLISCIKLSILTNEVQNGRPVNGSDPNKFDSQMGCIPTKGGHCSIDKNGDLFNLLTLNSFQHIGQFMEYYYNHNDQHQAVYDLMSENCGEGETKQGYLKILRFAFDPVAYSAVELYDGLTSQRDSRDGMDRIIISRSEVDLFDVQNSFFLIYDNATVAATIDDPTGPTITDQKNDVEKDVNDINAASQKDKIDLRKIIDILTKRTATQRIAIKQAFSTVYKKSLPATIAGITNDKLKFLLLRLLYSPAEYAARTIRFSLKFDQDWSYMSVLCSTNADQLKKIVDTYKRVYNQDLVDELNQKMKIDSGKQFLKQMIEAQPGRPAKGADPSKFDGQMDCIPTKGGHCSIKKNGDLFNLLTLNSFEHISQFMEYYYNHKDNQAVYDLMSTNCGDGETKEGYLKILRYAFDPVAYSAVELYDGLTSQRDSREGMDRIIISRSEIDLFDVQKSFFLIYDNATVAATIDTIYGTHDPDYTYALKNILNGNKA
ncbi:annexin A2 isoform X2 [Nilaparvata lugens]|uniref:annexin A2 isoform X2 n=1 Tax=Nilaparvata lugens TaxID=108931 RepID=UPI00193DC599|nr:annexin A2 isoform X2 [Nilaparvata lugens]